MFFDPHSFFPEKRIMLRPAMLIHMLQLSNQTS